MIDHFLLRETVLGRRMPASIQQVGQDVWKMTLSDGLQVALKRIADGPDPDPFDTESSVLKRLHGLGCPVPEVYLIEPSVRVLVTAWAGDRTMDDLCQEDGQDAAGRCGREIAEGLYKIEAVMTGEARPGEALILKPDAEHEAILLRDARQGAEDLLCGDIRSLARAREELERVMEGIRLGARFVASLDYNARNVVIDPGGTVRFIDFSAVGWDWPERRFVQYVTGLGAYRKRGRLVSPLTPELAGHYARVRCRSNPDADERAVVRAVDAHDLLFHLVILARLSRLRHPPETAESLLLRRAWDGLKERRVQAILNLGRPLSDAPDVNTLRDLFRKQ